MQFSKLVRFLFDRSNNILSVLIITSSFLILLGWQVFFPGCARLPVSRLDQCRMAEELYRSQKYDRAGKLYSNLLLENPGSSCADKAEFFLGQIYLHQKKYQKARSQFEKFIQNYPLSPHLPEAKLGLGESCLYLQDYTKALSLFQEYLRQDGQAGLRSEALAFLAEAYFALGDYSQALDKYTSLQLLDPQKRLDPTIIYQISLCQIYLKQYEQAIDNLTLLLNTKYGEARQAQIHQFLAKAHLGRKATLEAIGHWLFARKNAENPQDIAVYEQEISSIIQNQLTLEECEILFKRYEKRYPADLAMIRLGSALQKKYQLIEAKRIWGQFIADFPRHDQQETARLALKDIDKQLAINQNKLGCIIPLSGELAGYGDKVVKGAKLAIEEFNRRHHANIQLILVDSKGNPEYGKNGVKVLVEKEQVIAIIGPLLSSVAHTMTPEAEELGVCVITPTAAGKNIPESSPYIFSNCLTNEQQGRVLAEYAVEVLSLKRMGILYPYNPYGIELMKIFAREIERLGGKIEIIEFYEGGDTDFRYQLERINKAGPQGLFIPGYSEEIILITPQVHFYVTSLVPAMQLLGSDSWYAEKVLTQGGKYIEGAIFTVGFCKESDAAQVVKFTDSYQKKYGQSPDLLSAQGYDITNIILEALMKCERVDREEVRKSISKIRDFHGVTGLINFSSSGVAIKKIPVLTIKNGQFIQVN